MRQEKIIFEKALRRITLFWKLVGLEINYDNEYKKQNILNILRNRWFYLTNFCWLNSDVFSFLGTLSFLSIQEILYMCPCVCISYLGNLKTLYFLSYESCVHDIINTLRSLQSSDDTEDKDEVDNEFVTQRLPFLNTANMLLLLLCSLGIATFCVGPFIVIFMTYMATNEIKLFLPFIIWYPFDAYSIKFWPIAYVHQFWSTWVAVFFVYGPDRFFYTCCAFIHSQFRSLQYDLQNIGPATLGRDVSLNMYFGTLIHRHRQLIRCVNMLNIIYGKSTLYNVVSSSFIICLAGFNITAIDNLPLMIPFAAVLFLGFVQIFMFCYYGDLIMRASLGVSDAIFHSQWHQLDPSSMKTCLFILMRAQKPCELSASGYRVINLMTFARILSSAWSYFTLVKTMYSKKTFDRVTT